MVIQEEWFDDMNLTDGEIFLMDLIKRAKNRFNKKIKPVQQKSTHKGIAVNNGWNTQILHILCEIRKGNIIFKECF